MAQTNDFSDRFEEVGALWVTRTEEEEVKSVSVKVVGKIENENLVAFPNKFKEEGDNRPDFRLFRDTQDNGKKTPNKPSTPEKKKRNF